MFDVPNVSPEIKDATLKNFFYEWGGLNRLLFENINPLGDDTYRAAMYYISFLGNYRYFPFYLALFGVIFGIVLAKRLIKKQAGTKIFVTRWLGVFAILVISFVVNGLLVRYLKEHFDYPRPYQILDQAQLFVRLPANNANEPSFPSGHASIIALVVASVWPILGGGARLWGCFLIFAVAWSRVALGVHFPADVVWGVFIGCMVVIVLRLIIYKTLRLFKIQC